MNIRKILNAALAVSLLLATACGGGGGGGNSSKPSQNNEVTVYTDAEWVACQDGKNGAWESQQRTSLTGRWQVHCTVNDPAGRYGIAVANTKNNSHGVKIFQATLNETRKVSLVFDQSFTPVDITIDITNVSGSAATQQVFLDESEYAYNYTTNGSTQEKAPLGTWDIIAAQFDNQGDLVGDILLKRQVPITQGTTLNIDYSEQGIPGSALFEHSLSVIGRGTATAEAFISTAGHTLVSTGSSMDGKWSGITYNPQQYEGLTAGDRYLFIAYDDISGTGFSQNYEAMFQYNAINDPGDIDIDLSTRNLLVVTELNTQMVTWEAYSPASTSPPLRAFAIDLFQNPNITWFATISTGWLDTGETSYAIPDSRTLGFPPEYDFVSGTPVDGTVSAVMFNISPEKMAVLQAPLYWLGDLTFESASWSHSFVAP